MPVLCEAEHRHKGFQMSKNCATSAATSTTGAKFERWDTGQPNQSNAEAPPVWQVDFFCTLPIVPKNLVVSNEHDQGDRASMLRNVRRHHYVGECDHTCSISGFDVKAEPNSDIWKVRHRLSSCHFLYQVRLKRIRHHESLKGYLCSQIIM